MYACILLSSVHPLSIYASWLMSVLSIIFIIYLIKIVPEFFNCIQRCHYMLLLGMDK